MSGLSIDKCSILNFFLKERRLTEFVNRRDGLHTGQGLFVFGNGGDAAALCGGQSRNGAGEADNVGQLFRSQLLGVLAVRKQLPDGTAAEDIAGAGGIDDLDAA